MKRLFRHSYILILVLSCLCALTFDTSALAGTKKKSSSSSKKKKAATATPTPTATASPTPTAIPTEPSIPQVFAYDDGITGTSDTPDDDSGMTADDNGDEIDAQEEIEEQAIDDSFESDAGVTESDGQTASDANVGQPSSDPQPDRPSRMHPDRPKGLTETQTKNLIARLQSAVKDPIVKPQGTGIMIRDLQSDEILFQLNPDLPLVPASNMKLFTTVAALNILTPEYTFETKVYRSGDVSGGVIDGNLLLVGGGDPFLVPEQLWQLAQKVAATGIRKVSGDLIVDSSFFDSVPVPDPDWNRLGKSTWYSAPMCGLSYSFNVVTVTLKPGEKPGAPPQVILDPPDSHFSIVNNGTTGAAKTKSTMSATISETDSSSIVTVRGSIPLKGSPKSYRTQIKHPDLFAGGAFRALLAQNGVTVTGVLRAGKRQGTEKQVAIIESQTLSHILMGANKFSNNFMVEQILKTIGAETYSSPGSTISGARAVKEFLKEVGINTNGFFMNDGSGLSRKNRVTPRQLADCMRFVLRDSTFAPELLNSLPVAGIDGTLRKRFKSDARSRLIRAKTGLINNVSCLTGVVDGRQGKGFVFSIMVNKSQNQHAAAKALQDKILKILLDAWIGVPGKHD